jgi:hypothetical protein
VVLWRFVTTEGTEFERSDWMYSISVCEHKDRNSAFSRVANDLSLEHIVELFLCVLGVLCGKRAISPAIRLQ